MSRGLELGDAVAADLLAAVAPLRFEEVRNDAERQAAYRLRYLGIVERNMAPAERFPDGKEHDVYDERAVHIVGWDGERPIATIRLVLPLAGRRLPVEDDFDLDVPGSEHMVDLGRGVVDPQWRSGDHRIFMGLMGRSWLSMRSRGFTKLLAAATPERVALYRSMGFAATVLAEPRSHWGEPRVPFFIDGEATAPELAERWGDTATARLLGSDSER
jgi:hypothetical protein